ncbi:hypothetical protein VPH35_079466 [Triticum aestivum]|uniref:Uncharacterized protein n=1 Tax=Aegilops tauschii TaxID=37682 RepID=M8BJ87_AEGTA
MKLKMQNQKINNKVEQGTASKEPFTSVSTDIRVAGQKRKQTKVYRPKGTATNTELKMKLDNNSKAIVLGGNNLNTSDLGTTLCQMYEEGNNDSYKKQKTELNLIPLRSADQAEAAVEQPRHTQ